MFIRTSRFVVVAVGIAVIAASAQSETSPGPYAGQQARSIKALSDADIAGLLEGSGAGFAKAAELNGYPGPAHVLELSAQLRLDASQESETRELLSAHKERARKLGFELVAAERELDRLFTQKLADASAVDQATQQVGRLQAQVRAEHLKTHLTQAAMLRPEQIRQYAVLRGYAAESNGAAPAQQDHSSHSHH